MQFSFVSCPLHCAYPSCSFQSSSSSFTSTSQHAHRFVRRFRPILKCTTTTQRRPKHISNCTINDNDNSKHFELKSSPSTTPPPPPPGREDEFADSNGDSLQDEQGKSRRSKVATLEKDLSFDTVLQELSAIQQDGPRNVAILGTRHTSYLHQQIIELLTYANVLVGNHVFTSGAGGTNAAVIRGALRAERPDLLTVVLPQSLRKQPSETQEQLKKVGNLIEMRKNDPLPLDIASQLCNSDILSRCTHFIAFAFHDSDVVLESVRQAKELRIVVTVLYLD